MAAAGMHIAGMAWATALGDDLDAVWRRLLSGATGLARHPGGDRVRNPLAALVPGLPPDLSAGERLRHLAAAPAQRALAQSGIDPADAGTRLILGTSLGSFIEESDRDPSGRAWAERLARDLGFAAPPLVVTTACSAGSDAVLLGAALIRAGRARACLCGGVDVLTPAKRLAHSALGSMSPTLLRAFDTRHDGTLLGEGAAFLALALPGDGPAPLAVLAGAGSANDASGMTTPDRTGGAARLAIERALADAGRRTADVGLINAHGSGTPLNDATERGVYNALFADPPYPLVFATKGSFGHTLGATGVIEAIALVLALRTGQVPPIHGLEHPDPEFALPLALGGPTPCGARCGLSVTLGFGGFDTCLLVEVPP